MKILNAILLVTAVSGASWEAQMIRQNQAQIEELKIEVIGLKNRIEINKKGLDKLSDITKESVVDLYAAVNKIHKHLKNATDMRLRILEIIEMR